MEMKKQKSDRDKVFSGLFWKFGERILAQGIAFVISVVLARVLLPEQYGTISMVMIFITFANVFVISGFSTSLIQKKDATDTDFSTIFYCSLAVSVFIYLILFFAAPFVAAFFEMPQLAAVLRVLSLRIIISSYNSTQHAYVSRNMQFRRFFFSTLSGILLSGVVGIVMAYSGFGVWALVGQNLSNAIMDSVVLTFTISWKPKLVFSLKSAKGLMSFGWKVLATDFMGTFFDQLRSIIVGKVYTSADLAYYNRGKQFSGLLTDNISASVMSVLFPSMANYSDNPGQIKNMIRRGLKVMCYIIFPLTFGCIAVADNMVQVLLTEKWMPSVFFIRVLCLSGAISLVGSTSLQTIKAIGRGDILLKLEFVKKPVYLILLIVGVYFNVEAVAVTMLIYAVYSTGINAGILRKNIGYTFWEQIKDMQGAFLLSATMLGIVYGIGYLPLPDFACLVLQVAAGVVVYVGLSMICKVDAYMYLKKYLVSLLKRKGVKKNSNYDKLWKKYGKLVEEGISCEERKKSDKVWICWFQGMETAPELVKACVASAKKQFADKEVILLSEENLGEYIQLPDYIMEKRSRGIIPPAQFSDLVRIELLCQYGGLWLDATVYCTHKAGQKEVIFNEPFFVFQQLNLNGEKEPESVASSWFLYGESNHPIYCLTRKLLFRYWKDYDSLLDYFIFHMFFAMATRRYPKEWKAMPIFNNHSPHVMYLDLEKEYTEDRWNQLCAMSDFHKLKHHTDLSHLNEKTFYGHLVAQEK